MPPKVFKGVNETKSEKEFLASEIRAGKVFIYPTDTVYGLGCDATSDSAVNRIRDIKRRDSEKPMSVAIPSSKWLEENCVINDSIKSNWLSKLPGAYTFILEMKDNCKVVCGKYRRLGIRIPSCWFQEIVQESGIAFVSTSVNLAGEPSITKIEDIPEEILEKVDYIIEDDNALSGKASTIVDLSDEKEVVLRK